MRWVKRRDWSVAKRYPPPSQSSVRSGSDGALHVLDIRQCTDCSKHRFVLILGYKVHYIFFFSRKGDSFGLCIKVMHIVSYCLIKSCLK